MTGSVELPPPGPHGGDGARLAAALGVDPDDVLDLSASLNPVLSSAVVAEVVERYLGALGRYPDPSAATAALARVLEVSVDEVVLTNGGAEAITLVASELGGVVDREPDFSLYPRAGAAAPRWRSNPHSPTGVLVDPATRPDIEVWDEAFYPLAAGRWTSGVHRIGATVVGSLTKLLSCPGLRVGYLISADGDLVARLRDRQSQWAVNGLVCEALPELLDLVELPGWKDQVSELRDRFAAGLAARLGGLGGVVRADAAPWVLVESPLELRSLLAPHGIAVRDAGSFGLSDTTRIAVPSGADQARFFAALDHVLRV